MKERKAIFQTQREVNWWVCRRKSKKYLDWIRSNTRYTTGCLWSVILALL